MEGRLCRPATSSVNLVVANSREIGPHKRELLFILYNRLSSNKGISLNESLSIGVSNYQVLQ